MRASCRLALKSTLLSALAVALSGASATITANAAELDPGYQVKLKLAPAAISAQGTPSQDYLSNFSILSGPENEQVAYLDTDSHYYSKLGWSIRLRLKEGADAYDVTYKYRHPLADATLSKDSIDAGIAAAEKKNFDASDSNYEPQVNVSFHSATLDFSNKKLVDCAEYSCVFPAADVATTIAADLEPGKLRKASGTTLSTSPLDMSIVSEQHTWRTEIDGIKTDLEITQVGDEFWGEISEEDSSRKDARDKRERLIAALDNAGLLAHEDAFKTSFILEQQ